MKKVIYSTPDISELKILNESVNNSANVLYAEGIIQRANTVNNNGRIYPKELLIRELKKMDELIEQGIAFGELDHDDEMELKWKKVSHRLVKYWWSGNDLYGRLEFLPTPHGEVVKNILKMDVNPKVPIGVSSRGFGSVVKKNDIEYVQDDFELVCFDIVTRPSTQQAFVSLVESNSNNKNVVNNINLEKSLEDFLENIF